MNIIECGRFGVVLERGERGKGGRGMVQRLSLPLPPLPISQQSPILYYKRCTIGLWPFCDGVRDGWRKWYRGVVICSIKWPGG